MATQASTEALHTPDNTFGATHYFNPSIVLPPWAKGKVPSITIGQHAFYANIL